MSRRKIQTKISGQFPKWCSVRLTTEQYAYVRRSDGGNTIRRCIDRLLAAEARQGKLKL